MNKYLQVFNQICNDLITNQIPFMVFSDSKLYIVLDKATLTIKKTGACILKTNLINANTILSKNTLNNTREIWTGAVVSEYSAQNTNTIVNDIKQL